VIWRCIVDAPRDGAANMALDHALFERVQAGDPPVLRLYRWDPPCLSFGRNQVARNVYDPATCADLGVDIVRRPTGGLAVFHHRELTYAVLAPVAGIGRPREAYASINRALAAGLARLGAAVAIARPGIARARPIRAARHPCFMEAAPGEVVLGNRKLAGSAMRFEKRTILQHGSILLDGDQSEIAAFETGPRDITDRSTRLPASAPAAISLNEAIGRIPGWSELYDAVLAGFADVFGITFSHQQSTAGECRRAHDLEARYRSGAWTWRR